MSNFVTVTVNGKEISALAGTLLSDALGIEKPCGGRGTCGKCKVKVNGKETLACRYVLREDVLVEARERGEILSVTGAEESGRVTKNLCFALDIGTTTLALALVSLDEKRTVRAVTATNPQRAFGADVITRIDFCRKHSVERLHTALIGEIDRMISALGAEGVERMYVSGNVTMLHTFFGVDCASIGVAPYTPAFLERRQVPGEDLGLHGVNTVISLPSVASFVGADIVAGLHLIGTPPQDGYYLLVDLGTNAEVVLFSRRGGLATAAAAGPCFEGANISCGMSATRGAICAFSLENGAPVYQTVGNEKGVGICGTGLVDLVSELVQSGVIDESGYMEEDYPVCDGVYLSCDDVRQYQLAKSAVCSAILSLMKAEGIGFESVTKMYISGGFSAKINIVNAVKSGLLPAALASKAVAIHNSSLQGTVKYACEGGDLTRLTEGIKYADLSASPCFSKLFMENMTFGQDCEEA